MRRHRDAGEVQSEFLASTDNWFRPVQARTGPDGALYVVDMYRFMIEHPRWIPAERLAQLDVRAGADMGRIYRVKPSGAAAALRPVRDLTKLSAADLAAAINTPNGTERDRVHVELLNRNDPAAAAGLEKVAADAEWPQARLQALAALDGIGALKPALVARALSDKDAQVRKQAVRLSETQRDTELESALLGLVNDSSPLVRIQLAFTLGEWDDARAGEALAKLAVANLDDADLRSAVLSSAVRHCGTILAAVMASDEGAAGRDAWIPPLVATAASSSDEKLVAAAVAAVLPSEKTEPGGAHFAALAGLLDALGRRGVALPEDVRPRVERVRTAARRTAGDDTASADARGEALKLLGRGQTSAEELDVLCRLVADAPQDELRAAALSAVAKQPNPDVATRLLANWQHTSPAARADVINVLLGREEWTTALLAAVKDKRVAPQEVSLADRQRLATSSNPSIKQLAADTFPARSSDSREQVIRQYATVASLKGDAAKGQEVFAKNCSACHILNGVGHEVGPDLAALRDKDPDYFVKNVLDPNAIIEPRFVNYNVILKDRRVLAGIIKSETATSLALSVGAGAIENVARADIKDIRATGTSMMPEGLEAGIPPQQMADLIAFIKSGTPRRKQLPENTPALVKQAGDGSLLLPATKAEFYGDGPIVLESEFKNVGWWNAAGDYVAWTAQVDKAGDYDVYADYACEQSSAGNKFVISFGDATLGGSVAGTGPDWSNYHRAKIGTVRLSAGQHRVTVRPDGALRNSLMDLRALALTPKGVAPKWPAPARSVMPADLVLRDAPTVARFIMDTSNSDAAREAAVNANPQFAADLIAEMTRDLAPGATEQQRIPWIWRVAIAAGRRNDASATRRILEASLPRENEPLRDWQAVVIGGGIINGITQVGAWPADRVKEILGEDELLTARWTRALDLASPLADDANVKTGTRYDALRMLGVQPWDKRGEQLSRYLAKDANAELQAGAVSAIGDINDARATQALIAAFSKLTEANRKLALQALLRDDQRTAALRDAVSAGKVEPSVLDADAKQRLGAKAK
jgi:putative heme-binding domain-containing protein